MRRIENNVANAVKIEAFLGKPLVFFAFAVLSLLSFNLDRLLDPPYWDAITGVYSQGVWLFKNHLNYIALYGQPGFGQGGPIVGLMYVHALVFALLNFVFSPPIVFFIFHMFTYIAAAVVMTVFFLMLRSRLSFWESLLWVLVGSISPIWTSQTAGIYLEIPTACCMAVSFFYFWRKNFLMAALFCFLGFLFKGTALLQAVIYAIMVVVLKLSPRNMKSDVGRDVYVLLIPLIVICSSLFFIKTTLRPDLDLMEKGSLFIIKARFLYPHLMAQMVLLMVFLGVFFVRGKIALREFLAWNDWHLCLCLLIFVFCFWVSFIVVGLPLVRYTAVVHFPMIYLLAVFLSRSKLVSSVAALTFVVYGGINQNGVLLPPLPSIEARSGHLLERSREYLKDLDENRNLCRFLEKNYASTPVLSKYPFVQMLKIPEFGYVNRPLPNVINAGLYSQVAAAIPLGTIKYFKPGQPVLCIYARSIEERSYAPSLKPAPDDEVVYEGKSLSGTLLVYQIKEPNKRFGLSPPKI